MEDGDSIHAVPRGSLFSPKQASERSTGWRDIASSYTVTKKRSPEPFVFDEIVETTRASETIDVRPKDEAASSGWAHSPMPISSGVAGLRRSNRTSVLAERPVKRLRLNPGAKPAPMTARVQVRADISKNTIPKREAFLSLHRDLFLPLLPERNAIAKLDSSQSIVEGGHVSQPAGVKATMKPYQIEGLNFLVKMYRNGMPAILGDEMGLGKTLQTLSLFQWLEESEPADARPYLVVCPLSVLTSWTNEAKRWTPALKTAQIHGPKSERVQLMQQIKKNLVPVNLVVTTYEAFVSERNWFQSAFVWRYVVLDEGHKIKNEQTAVSHALQSLSAEYRLLVTGTPLQNNMNEAWALLHWLLPEVFTFDTQVRFKQSFDLARGTVSTKMMGHLRRLLELIMLRRMKSSPGVDLGLPPKEEVVLFVPLTPMQRQWYLQLLTRIDQATLQDVFHNAKSKERFSLVTHAHPAQPEQVDCASMSTTPAVEAEDEAEPETNPNQWKKLQNLVMQLRKVCSHPYLIAGAQPVPYKLEDAVRLTSGKFIVLDKLVEELVVNKRKKILIFSGFTQTLDLVEDLLTLKGANTLNGPFKYMRLDGGTARAKRNLGIRMFNDMTSDFQVMLISTRAGGLGINLTAANTVVFCDEDWNPQVTLQAEARAHRIGQTQKVTVYKLCTKGTVEEQMIGRIQKKLYLSTKVTETMRNLHTQGSSKKKGASDVDDELTLGSSQLKSLLRRGAHALAGPEISSEEMETWTWSTILEKCKDRPMDAEVELNEQTWLNQIERVETAVFEGKKWQRQKAAERAPELTLNRADRRQGKHTTVRIDGYDVSKDSLLCADWEAVPTMAGKDPRLAEPKHAKRVPFDNQSHCQSCWDGGELVLCSGCPRSYHHQCLDKDSKKKANGMSFHCSQHNCWDCGKKTADAGGLIYRCRWCEYGWCEDCLDWDKTKLLGASLPEFDVARYSTSNAWFIECPDCLKGDRIAWILRSGWLDVALGHSGDDTAAVDDSQLTWGSGDTSVVESEIATPEPHSSIAGGWSMPAKDDWSHARGKSGQVWPIDDARDALSLIKAHRG